MKDATNDTKGGRKVRTLDEEIAAQREKLKKLEDKQREIQRKDREKNQKAVLELIKAEKLDTVSADQWRAAMPAIKAALLVNPSEAPQAVPAVQKTATGTEEA
jgi:Spy/CpxP family protein refolding chaperone